MSINTRVEPNLLIIKEGDDKIRKKILSLSKTYTPDTITEISGIVSDLSDMMRIDGVQEITCIFEWEVDDSYVVPSPDGEVIIQ